MPVAHAFQEAGRLGCRYSTPGFEEAARLDDGDQSPVSYVLQRPSAAGGRDVAFGHMEWTRSPLMRAIAMAASLGLVAIHWDDRGPWFWVGVALVMLNVAGLLAAGSRAHQRAEVGFGHPPATSQPQQGREDGESHRLDELLTVPGVAAAFAAGPRLWQQVSYLDEMPLEPMTPEELATFVWLENDDGDWAIGLADEVKPYLDLDVDEEDDPIIGVLRTHAAVQEAYHEDREVYRVEQRRPMGTEEFAELAARALVSHHSAMAAGPSGTVRILQVADRDCLTFTCGVNPSDPTIAAMDHEPNGYFWQGIVEFAFPRVAELELDPEASSFCAFGADDVLRELRAFLTPLLTDGAAIAALIARARAQGFEIDG